MNHETGNTDPTASLRELLRDCGLIAARAHQSVPILTERGVARATSLQNLESAVITLREAIIKIEAESQTSRASETPDGAR